MTNMEENQENIVVSVVKINTPLSNHPFFVKIGEQGMSVDAIFNEAILQLKNSGKPLESQQLEQLYANHQLFQGSKIIEKGSLFTELEKKMQQVGNVTAQVAQIDMIASHSGGGQENAQIISNMNTAISVVHEMPTMPINMNDDASDWSERLNTIVTEYLSIESLAEMPFAFHVDSNESNEHGSIEIYLDEDFNVDEEIEDKFTELKHKLENEIQANISLVFETKRAVT